VKRDSSQGQSSAPASGSPRGNSQQSFPHQQPLSFETADETLNDDALVRATVSTSIRQSPLSRDQIADAMTAMLGVSVTTKMLNNFSSKVTQGYRFPAAWDRAFCRAVSDDALLTCRVERAGLFVISAEEKDILELGRQYLIRKRADEQAQLLEKRLEGADL
jgi:hypothetical protein